MTNFRTFILGLAASFGLPWLCLIVLPAMQYEQLAPVAYDKEKDGVEGYFPPAPINGQGQLVYISEGCNQCHSQMIRPIQLGLDGWYKGWGQDQEARPATPARPSVLRDYLGERYALLGIQRVGPDLANFGWRAPDANALHVHLYSPRAVNDWSTMPSYKNLYKLQKVQGPVSSRALKLPKKFAPPAGYEVVPTPEADRLVEYLLSLKKDYPVPGQGAAVAASPAKK
ncbi:cbb3-type cytochrome c oxidase subunit II [Prosthecobacter sp.]|uniref:cbb3-type cytochrome c oxidase subunit II n=1 Tax=Prosthecobacter sp. TaxID=1965333 RepID=UPI003783D4F2